MFKITPPTDEEMREVALRWYANIGPTLIDQWPEAIHALSMPTKLVPLPIELMEPLFDGALGTDPRFDALAADLDAAMGWDRHFIRLNSRSPKDMSWPFELPATCSGKEAIGFLAGSERILDDLCMFRRLPEHPAYICLRKFIPGLRPDQEYRCFVRDRQIIAVTHYDYRNPIAAPDDGGRAIREKIGAWFDKSLLPHLPVGDVVFDVHLPYWGDEILLIELNPYGLSDPCWLGDYSNVESFAGYVAFAPSPPRPDDAA